MTKNVEYCETRELRERDTIVATRREKEVFHPHTLAHIATLKKSMPTALPGRYLPN